MELKWTKFALDNLHSYQNTSKKGPINLRKYYQSFQNCINGLTVNPKLGKVYSNIDEYIIRQLIFKEHRILYLIDEDTIILLALVHTSYPLNEALNYIEKYLTEL